MALLNRFSKLNDRGETGIFTFIVTKSVTRDFHRDATTKDFCFGYHRWAISFQRPSEKVLGVHLLLRNPSPNTACVVDFTLTLLNREHFSQNEVYSKRQAKFTITNPMQGVARWIQMSDLVERHFSSETGEFLFELALSNMTTVFECDIQLNPAVLSQYKSMLATGYQLAAPQTGRADSRSSSLSSANSGPSAALTAQPPSSSASASPAGQPQQQCSSKQQRSGSSELINLETNYFTFGSFDWSLTILPLVIPTPPPAGGEPSATPSPGAQTARLEPVCRVYLNRLNGLDCLCRVRYRVILGHHNQPAHQHNQPAPQQPPPSQAPPPIGGEFVDSRQLDQVSDTGGRIRGYQFRNTNILKLISLRTGGASSTGAGQNSAPGAKSNHHHHHGARSAADGQHRDSAPANSSLDLRVHIEMFCANTISEARVPLQRRPNEPQVGNCCDRNKQTWCVESDCDQENVRVKLFFMDVQSVPRNHIRYISWCAYIVKRDPKTGASRESLAVRNSPHCNYYLQDGIDMGTIMDTDIPVRELNETPKAYLEANQLTVHIEWIDSLLLFSHLYNNYDSLATIQRHQIRRELSALQQELEMLEQKYEQSRRALAELAEAGRRAPTSQDDSPCSVSSMSLVSGGEPAPPAKSALKAAGVRQLSEQVHALQLREPPAAPLDRSARAGRARLSLGAAVDRQLQPLEPGAGLHLGAAFAAQPAAAAKLPMSLDERLKFSASTPPLVTRRRLPIPQHPQPADQQQQQQQPVDSQKAYQQRRADFQAALGGVAASAPLELAGVGGVFVAGAQMGALEGGPRAGSISGPSEMAFRAHQHHQPQPQPQPQQPAWMVADHFQGRDEPRPRAQHLGALGVLPAGLEQFGSPASPLQRGPLVPAYRGQDGDAEAALLLQLARTGQPHLNHQPAFHQPAKGVDLVTGDARSMGACFHGGARQAAAEYEYQQLLAAQRASLVDFVDADICAGVGERGAQVAGEMAVSLAGQHSAIQLPHYEPPQQRHYG